MPPPKSSSYQRGGGLGSDPGHAGLGTSWYSLEEIEEVDREREIWVSWLILGLIHATPLEKCTQMITKRGKEVRTED